MKVGFSNGCFQLLHEGHKYFLRAARAQCDYLVVAVNSDESIRRLKGPAHFVEPLDARIMVLKEFADAVIPFEGREEALLMEIRPDVIFKGHDHSPNQTHWAARVPNWKNGPYGMWTCPVVHIPKLEGYSTTAILEARHQ